MESAMNRRNTAGAMSQENVEIARRIAEAFEAGVERGRLHPPLGHGRGG